MKELSVFDDVQAVLLNSEGHPKSAFQEALLATLQFAYLECELAEDEVYDLLAKALVLGPKEDLW